MRSKLVIKSAKRKESERTRLKGKGRKGSEKRRREKKRHEKWEGCIKKKIKVVVKVKG